MSTLAEQVADQLAKDVMRQMDETGDIDLAREVTKMLATSSVPTEEAFNTAMRVLGAERRARALMDTRAKDHNA